ncbi:toxin-antitoxin system YwqK family antitoxin [Vibrio sp. S4M6]|uniref:toxin-antitoxin system YwqK family antitoxin n=1 Tax=Vibrio sinus TaxID=2946865 RepID=UPI00202A9EED|nr:toxin-antitoxin system YwqK family antitoxin [Vibrio sinus]MCL9781758.1 toxin-antitoxin system YwqK family antitoxin [Vibrio sinus]
MKKYIPLIIALSAVSGASYAATTTTNGNTVDYLQVRQGVAYQVNQTTPFTGKYAEKYDNGQYATKTQFKNGLEYGLETNWYVNGQTASKIHYVKGKIDGKVEAWYPNGAKKAVLEYKNGKLNGPVERWFPNGEKRLTAHYVNGKQDGTFTHYYPNGHKATEAKYKDGALSDGKVTCWDPDGQKVEQLTFRHQRLISEQSWLPSDAHS